MTYFYSNLITIESVLEELNSLDLTGEQRTHLADLLDSSLHHTILDAILSELSDQDKRVFLLHLNKNDHDMIWKFLNEKVLGVESKIQKAAEDLKEELHKDLKKAKQTK